jgi:PAS domain S-box-containing protein
LSSDENPLLRDRALAHRLLAYARGSDQAIFVGGPDGCVEWANDAACRLCGCALEELVGRRVHLFPDDAEAQRAASDHVGRRLVAGERARLEAALRDRSGRSLWIDLEVTPVPAADGAPAGWVAVARDVTERKRAEAALAESEQRYRSLVEGSPEPVAVHSQGRIVYANRAALELLGASSSDQVLGKPVFDFLHPDYHRLASERILKMELVGDPAEKVVERLLRVDGSPVEVELAATPISWRGAPAIQLAGHALSEPPPARPPLLDLSSLVLELAPRIEDRIAPRAVVSFDLTGALVAVPGEARALADAVCAVVAQAAAALPDGRGALLLRTGVRELSGRDLAGFVPSRSLAAGRFLLLEAFANGGGLDARMRAQLFDEAFPERFPRRGPGLAGALAVARDHRGGLRVQSGAQGGLRISLALPAARAPRRAGGRRSAEARRSR